MDINAPYCGNLQFAKSYSSLTEMSNYVEGTADNRKVSDRAILVKECDVLLQWGLEGLMCVVDDNAVRNI